MLGWSEAHLKLGVETFDPPKFGTSSKSNGALGQFLISNMPLGMVDGLIRFEIKVLV